MNNFERQDMIDEMTAKHTARQLAGMLIDAQAFMDSLSKENQELEDRLSKFHNADIPDGAKFQMIGEFTISHTETCSACYFDEPHEDCEVCGGDVDYDQSIDVPWSVQKDIFKAFCDIASKNYAN